MRFGLMKVDKCAEKPIQKCPEIGSKDVWFRICDIPIVGALSFFATVDLLPVCSC